MVPDLSRILALATYLDDPQLSYPTIHVTGTNGKGTAARVATEIACAHGLTTGLYTSPHLESVTERLSVCGVDITEKEFAEEFTHLQPFLELVDGRSEERVTYFEALTAFAYLWFADKPVALGVFEVGMGGTWDATNLISSDVAVITPIGLDHPELGATLTEVAGEKAGIIKDGKAVVVREQEAEALAVIESRCDQVGASLLARVPRLGGHRTAAGGRRSGVRGARPARLVRRSVPAAVRRARRPQRGGGARGVRVAVRRGPRRRNAARGARGRAVARASRGRRPAAGDRARRCAQPRRRRGARGRAAGVLPLGATAPRALDRREQGRGRHRRPARPARRRGLRGSQRERAHAATPRRSPRRSASRARPSRSTARSPRRSTLPGQPRALEISSA